MKKIFVILMTVIGFGISAINAQTSTINKDELKKCFTQYNKAINNEFYDIALENMQKASNLLPESFCPLINLAVVYRMQGNYQEAINQLNKSIMLLDEDNFQNIGDICDCEVGSCSSYKDAATSIYAELFRNYSNLKNYDKAISSANKLITIDKEMTSEVYLAIADIYFQQEKYTESEHYAKQILLLPGIKNDTNILIITYNILALIYEEQKDNAKTIEYIKKMAELGSEEAQKTLQVVEKQTSERTCGLVFLTKSGEVSDTPPLENQK